MKSINRSNTTLSYVSKEQTERGASIMFQGMWTRHSILFNDMQAEITFLRRLYENNGKTSQHYYEEADPNEAKQ